ncbi:hypothetical protein Agub_g6065 [Astrephomene gubernaculifera]|uniref:Uncharacterized protein n=1 Tax=Astrephomene gubernaculifera TaxID=47775 RepID=A0AAD3HL45_9CHLO|nr:hypothetical protein Agub_g6065 [Astrephomene gubernaculifera]
MASTLCGPNALLAPAQARRNPIAFSTGGCAKLHRTAPIPPRSSPLRQPHLTSRSVAARAENNNSGQASGEAEPRRVVYNTEFGYSRKDVLLICFGLLGLGFGLYGGLQAAGLDAGQAGNWVQLLIFLGICVGWVSTYIYRVATKQMTYVKQLEAYEEAVIRRRVDEMTEAELAALAEEVEAERAAAAGRRKQQK